MSRFPWGDFSSLLTGLFGDPGTGDVFWADADVGRHLKEPGAVERFDAADFRGTTLDRAGSWGVCFSADWCPFCRRFLPLFHSLEGKAPFGVAVADVTDLDSPLWETFRIEVVPTLAAFIDGAEVWRRDGVLGEGLEPRDLEALRGRLAGTSSDAMSS